jgi:hypothetical protein
MSVLAEGPSLSLVVNDTVLEQVTDESFTTGELGFAAGNYDDVDIAASFDAVEIWDLSE